MLKQASLHHQTKKGNLSTCYHCGEPCGVHAIVQNGKSFCCSGCELVYSLLNEHGLCQYYNFNKTPGQAQREGIRENKFAFLDDAEISSKLISFSDSQVVQVLFYLPQMHCSSCIYLLEKLNRIDPSVISGTVNFVRRELTIVFNKTTGSVRRMAELLSSVGYEPYISLNVLNEKKPVSNRMIIYQLGVAGFCFGNIMLMSFPEYFGISETESTLRGMFRWLNFFLSLPVLFFSAVPFYRSAIAALRLRYLNIDVPIVLAILITFGRSCFELFFGDGSGYFDSMTGIVFFMLSGKFLQDKTRQQLSFERDYSSYFPLAVAVQKNGTEVPTSLPQIRSGDILSIHHGELIPADGILSGGEALIDYSFVTGETIPVIKKTGDLLYAGGKQTGGRIELIVTREVAQSYLTGLWGKEWNNKKNKSVNDSFVHNLSHWFSWIVLLIALITAVYWSFNDSTRIFPAITAIFIIACPCALLLSNSFTNGNILAILSRNQCYLRHASVIEDVGKINHIVFDKTGTLTTPADTDIRYEGRLLSPTIQEHLSALARNSSHPLCRVLLRTLKLPLRSTASGQFCETPGEGIEGNFGDLKVKLGSASFVGAPEQKSDNAEVFLRVGEEIIGKFLFRSRYRKNMFGTLKQLKKTFGLSVLSGDNSADRERISAEFEGECELLFNQKPDQKLSYISQLQERGKHVMMVGDGLNDAPAFKQSDCGVAVSEHNNNFTPASDIILSSESLSKLDRIIRLCRINRGIVTGSFAVSVIYNITGLWFAVQGNLSPLIAAILMPASTLSIFLISFGCSNVAASRLKL